MKKHPFIIGFKLSFAFRELFIHKIILFLKFSEMKMKK